MTNCRLLGVVLRVPQDDIWDVDSNRFSPGSGELEGEIAAVPKSSDGARHYDETATRDQVVRRRPEP